MPQFQYANNPATALSGSVTAGATSISVASGAAFPAFGNFTIIVESEIMLVTGVAGTTWTVTRGYDGTAAASHTNNTPVTAILTKASFLNAHWFDVRQYGARGDGSTDDTTALQAALTAASDAGGAEVYLPPGTYRTTAALTIGSNTFLRGAGDRSILYVDHTGYGLQAEGSLGTLYNLASNAARGDGTIILSAGTGSNFAANDIVWIQSEAQALGMAGHKKAELQVLRSVATDTLEFPGVILDSYATADTAKAGKITAVTNIGIERLKITQPRYDTATTTPTSPLVQMDFVHNARVRDVTLDKNNGAGITLRNCLNVTVQGCHIERLRDDTPNSIYGYGVQVGWASRTISIEGNTFRYCRHAVTTDTSSSGPTPNYGVQRAVTISGNSVSDCTHAGIDTHEDSDGVTISGNTIAGGREVGIQVRCYRANVSGNTILGIRGIGIFVNTTALDVIVEGNIVQATRLSPSGANGYGIWIGCDRVTCEGNRVTESYTHGIYVTAATTDINLSNNSIVNNGQGTATTYDGIHIATNVTRLVISGNTCTDTQGTKTQRYGIRFEAAVTESERIQVMNNNLSNNGTGAFSNAGTGTPQTLGNAPANAPGFTQRVKTSTGSVAAASTADVTVNWPTTFFDTDYYVQATCQGTNGQLEVRGIASLSASSCVIRVYNQGGSSITGTLHVTGIHA